MPQRQPAIASSRAPTVRFRPGVIGHLAGEWRTNTVELPEDRERLQTVSGKLPAEVLNLAGLDTDADGVVLPVAEDLNLGGYLHAIPFP